MNYIELIINENMDLRVLLNAAVLLKLRRRDPQLINSIVILLPPFNLQHFDTILRYNFACSIIKHDTLTRFDW